MSNWEKIMEDAQVLPCGCRVATVVVNGENTMAVHPCSQTCEYYLYIVETVKAQGKPIRKEHL